MANHASPFWQSAAPAQPERAASRSVAPAAPQAAPRPVPDLPGVKDDLLAALELVPLDLVSAPPHTQPPATDFRATAATGAFDAGGGSVAPPDAAGAAGSRETASEGASFVAPNAVSQDEANLLALVDFLPRGGAAGGSDNHQGAPSGPGGGGGGSQDRPHNPPRGRHRSSDPLWVFDANNGLYLADGGTVHDFAGWNVDLYAQVAGATVAANGYTWDLSGAPDVSTGTVTGQGTYHLHFQWNDFSDPTYLTHNDTVTLQTSNTDHTGEFQTFYFSVYEHGSNDPAWVPDSSRPTRTPTFPLLVPPDAVKPSQATIDGQYYSLGEDTGEVLTDFTLPVYHPAFAPLRLTYSSLAADPAPIFNEYYQLDPTQASVPTTVTASLYWNCTAGNCTSANLVASDSYSTGGVLNPGDVMDIALQYVPSSPSSIATGRYPYQIDVNAGGTVTSKNGYVSIVNESNSPFGAGWTLDNVERAWPAADGSGVTIELPGGQSLWYRSLGSGHYQSPPGDTATVHDFGRGGYERDLKDGTQIYFDPLDGTQFQVYDSVERRTYNFDFNLANPPQLQSISVVFHDQPDTVTFTLALSYNAAGKVSAIQDPVGRTTALGYDATNTQLTSITEPAPGHSETTPVFTYGYGSRNRLTSLTDPNNHQTAFTYTSYSGRVSGVTRADQTTESLTPQQMTALNPPGNTTAWLSVQAGAEYTDPRGKLWTDALDWSGFGDVWESFDPLLNETVVHRDTNGFPWLYEDPLDNATRTFFDQGSSVVQGNPTKVVLPNNPGEPTGLYEQNTYTGSSQLVSHRDANGNTVTFTFAPAVACLCARSQVLPPVGSPAQSPVTTFSYDDSAFLQGVTDPNGFTESFYYDPGTHSKVTGISFPPDAPTPSPNPSVAFSYDAHNYLASFTDELSHTASFTADNLGRVLVIQLPTTPPVTVSYITMTYDPAGNRLSLTDPTPLSSGSDITQFHYDAMNRVDRVTDPNGQVTTYVYDNAGNVQDIFDRDTLPSGNHRDRHFIYDDAGRLITEQWKDGSTVDYTASYGYDAASQLTSASDDNSSYSFAYDARGHRISADNANTLNIPHVVLTYVYDAVGNRTKVLDNLSPGGSITFAYDADNRLTGLTMNVTGATDHPVVTLQYDIGARLTSVSRSTASGGNQVNTALTYTQRNLVQSITHTSSTGSVTLAAYTYAYDLAQNLKTKSDQDSQGTLTFTYSYDAQNQLTGVAASNASYNESYSYTNAQQQDLNGNRASASFGSTSQTYGAPAPDNRLTTDGQYTYTYDNAGNLTNKTGREGGVTYSYDYTYDFRNRVTEVKKTAVASQIVVADDTFKYDVLDRRIGKRQQFGTQQWTAYDGDNAYADFSGQTLSTRYVFANGPDELVARTNASGNSTAWYLTDNIGSVRQIVDASGNSLYRANYFTFGGIVPGSELGSGGDRFKFAGREWDSEIGLYYNRARYYDPNTGRFISEDPLGFAGGATNLYVYAFNDPLSWVDEFGLAGDSVSRTITQTLASNDPAKIRFLAGTLKDAGAIDQAGFNQLIAAAVRLETTAAKIIAKECKGEILRKFPSELLNKSLAEIKKLADAGDKAAKTAWKLITDSRFKKGAK